MKYKETDLCIRCKKKPPKCRDLCGNCYNVYRRRKAQDQTPKKKCQCCEECQEMIPSIDQNGNIMRFKQHHTPFGENNKTLKYIREHTDGYLLEYCPDHHFADRSGHVLQHRLVYERYYNVCLLPWTEIHHNDRDKKNNQKISNLIPVSKSTHCIISQLEKKGKKIDLDKINRPKICIYPNCPTPTKTFIDNKGSEVWLIYKDGYICRNCYYKEYRKTHIRIRKKSN